MTTARIALASDHAGYAVKEDTKHYLDSLGYHQLWDFGTHTQESADYPDFVHPLAVALEKGEYSLGFIFCGSGNGVAITANKHQGIRAALCWNAEIAGLARRHNNANVCAIPARFVSTAEARQIVKSFLGSEFEGGRHQRRVEKIPAK